MIFGGGRSDFWWWLVIVVLVFGGNWQMVEHNSMSSLAERLRDNPPVKQYRIGEVAHFSGLSRQTVHNYTVMGLIREHDWTAGGHRLYDESVFNILARIDRLKGSRTLREIRSLLHEQVVHGRISNGVT